MNTLMNCLQTLLQFLRKREEMGSEADGRAPGRGHNAHFFQPFFHGMAVGVQ